MKSMERFLRFAGVGALATAILYLLLIAGVEIVRIEPVTASTIGFIIAALINYYLNRRYTFRSHKPHPEAISKFFTVALIGLVLNGTLLFVGTVLLGIHYLLAQVLATGLVLLWSYSANAVWTFAEPH